MLLHRSPDIIESGQQDEIVLLHPTTGQYITLSGSGAFIWQCLKSETGVQLENLITAVCQTYAVDHPTAKRDVNAFVDELLASNLLTTDSNAPT
ncbi:MAG: hypothetical protein RhofKO_32570 [Rhodothermales bacterium]